MAISCSRIVESTLCSRIFFLFQHDLCRYCCCTVFAVGVEYGGRGSHSVHYYCPCIIFADTLLHYHCTWISVSLFMLLLLDLWHYCITETAGFAVCVEVGLHQIRCCCWPLVLDCSCCYTSVSAASLLQLQLDFCCWGCAIFSAAFCYAILLLLHLNFSCCFCTVVLLYCLLIFGVHCKNSFWFSRLRPGCHLPNSPWLGII